MYKKIISLIMSIIICLSCIVVPCSIVEAAVDPNSATIITVRDNMLKRNKEFSVEFKSKNNDYRNLATSIVKSAVSEEYANCSDAGDYLKLSILGYACSTHCSKIDDLYTYKIDYSFQYYTTAEEEQLLKNKINSAISSLNLNKKSDYDKVKSIHDYICKNVKYDNKNLNNNNYTKKYTAYAALVNGTAVCQGYATLFYRMCKEVGIDSRIIIQNNVHSWNIVRIGNNYYNIDVTWDDVDNSQVPIRYDYFLKCNSCFTKHDKKDDVYNSDSFKNTYPINKVCYDLKNCKIYNTPQSPKISKVVINSASAFTATWNKISCTGYQIQYATKSDFSDAKSITIKGNSNVSKKITGLKKNKKYYIRVRCYTTTKFDGKNYNIYSSWSPTKSPWMTTATSKLSYTSKVYNGKVQTPSVTVKDSNNKTLKNGTDYTVSYASDRKNVGRYSIKITYKGSYGYIPAQTLYYNIVPKATTLKSVSAQSKGFTVNWNKQATQTKGYQIQYATKSNFSNAATIWVEGSNKTSRKITGRAGNTKYYVRVRTYKTVKFNGKDYNVFSSWSSAKAVTTKK